ncbi:MAG: signal peptide peptidase SppA [Sporomusaceae bacterium]|jgi:protease-4|nr:signal peptide peptidase SppA [Sporomusaceae bacterium]
MFKKLVVAGIAILVVLSLAFLLFGNSQKSGSDFAANKIALVHIDGVIVGGRGEGSLLGETGGTDAIIKQIRNARDDASVQAVVIRINSPGGSAPASQEVGEEVLKLKSSGKPVVISMADMAASGGYWIAACGDKIYANPSTLTGSIGVYVPYANLEELYGKIGFREEKIKSGPHKDMLSPERAMSSEERAIVQSLVDDIYSQFLDVVASGRNLDYEQVKKLADGRIYTGRQAKEAGLVDELGNMYDAIDDAAKMAGIKGPPQIIEYTKPFPFADLLGLENRAGLKQLLLQELKKSSVLAAPMALFEGDV